MREFYVVYLGILKTDENNISLEVSILFDVLGLIYSAPTNLYYAHSSRESRYGSTLCGLVIIDI